MERENPNYKHVSQNYEAELFQFDESDSWAKPQRPQKFGLDSELDDDELETILIVTQRKRELSQSPLRDLPGLAQNPSKPVAYPKPIGSKSTPVQQVTDMMSDGLYISARNEKSKQISDLQQNTVTDATYGTTGENLNQPPTLSSGATPVMNPKKFFRGANPGSPPIGWLVNHKPLPSKSVQVPKPQSTSHQSSYSHKQSKSQHSLGKSYKEPSSSSSSKDIQPFQHPSYELLKDNGFVQQKYTKYHAKAIKGNFLF